MRRLSSALFLLLCVGGAILSLGLVVHEATREVPVTARVVSTARQGLTTIGTVEVRNTSAQDRCVTVRLVAQDRDGHELGASAPQRLQLPARTSTRLPAALDLTARDYAERLSQLRAALASCPVERNLQK